MNTTNITTTTRTRSRYHQHFLLLHTLTAIVVLAVFVIVVSQHRFGSHAFSARGNTNSLFQHRYPLEQRHHHHQQQIQKQIQKQRQQQRQQPAQFQILMMVRNIDLPEAVIFYGTKTILPSYVVNESDEDAIHRFRLMAKNNDDNYDTTVIKARTGLLRFLQECYDIGTAVIVLLDRDDDDGDYDDNDCIEQQLKLRRNQYVLDAILPNHLSRMCYILTQTVVPPNPTDLLDILNTIMIQPRPYGSSGMTTIGYTGRIEPERLIVPQHCVVFTTSLQQTRVARAVGMRVVSINNYDNDHLADAALYENDSSDDNRNIDTVSLDISIDDIATPGSYWLNPPHPRDDNGNRVLDPYDILLSKLQPKQTFSPTIQNDDMDDTDDNFRALLADIAPLKRL